MSRSRLGGDSASAEPLCHVNRGGGGGHCIRYLLFHVPHKTKMGKATFLGAIQLLGAVCQFPAKTLPQISRALPTPSSPLVFFR